MRRPTFVLILAIVALAGVLAAACGNDGSAGPTGSATATPERSEAAGSSGGNLSTVELVQHLRPSVVHILSEASSFNVFGQVVPQEGVGTGFIIDTEGRIVTNNHVVTGQDGNAVDKITVTLADGREFGASVIGRDPPTDLAVLKIDAGDITPIKLGNASELQVGQDVVAMGNALNLPGGPTVTKGVVSALNRLIEEGDITIQDAIQTDASINPGNSGGPLVNMRGEVVGITTAVIRGNAESIGLAISIDSAKPIVQELIESGNVKRGLLGVTIVQITPSIAEQLNLPVDHGIGIRQVQAGGPAAKAGLAEGDIILKIQDVEINTSADLFSALSKYRAGETVGIDYYHNGKKATTDLTLGGQP
ncbi:MAG: trypsin-like peptidase domain-containing protein [Dehalococcoidia bacterium]|nr:trypsin-like peptidase domain-containing protein [Dehalococcoidia bacterium]